MNGIKLITFDATGTLIKFKKPPVEIYAQFGSEHGLNLSKDEIQTNFKKAWKTLNKENPHYGKNWQEWWSQFVFRTFQVENTTLASDLISHFSTGAAYEWHKDALQTLSKLKSTNYKLGVVSNSDPRLKNVLKTLVCQKEKYDDIMDKVAKEKLFSVMMLSHELQISKPDPKIFELARGTLKPFECLHIGDNLELDYLAAKDAGWNSIHFKDDFSLVTDLLGLSKTSTV